MGVFRAEDDPIQDILVITNPDINTQEQVNKFMERFGLVGVIPATHVIRYDEMAARAVDSKALVERAVRIAEGMVLDKMTELGIRIDYIGFVGGPELFQQSIAQTVAGLLEGNVQAYEAAIEMLANDGELSEEAKKSLPSLEDLKNGKFKLKEDFEGVQQYYKELELYREEVRTKL